MLLTEKTAALCRSFFVFCCVTLVRYFCHKINLWLQSAAPLAMSKRVLPLLSAGTIVAENLTFFIMIDTTQLTQFISAVVISIPI